MTLAPGDVLRHLDPATGDLAFDDAAGTWVMGGSVAMESAAFAVGTALGSCPLAPAEGVAWGTVQTLTGQAPATLQRIVLDGMKPLVSDGTLAAPAVKTSSPGGRRLAYDLSFTDPLAQAGDVPPTLAGTV